jgi:hypothetical protein
MGRDEPCTRGCKKHIEVVRTNTFQTLAWEETRANTFVSFVALSLLFQKLKKMNIVMAGLDVIDEQIIEVNVTSPCYFINEINNYFSINLEKTITECILNIVNQSLNCTIL